MSFSEKVYHLLLRAYPRRYYERYAEPMQQLFRDRLREAHTPAEFAVFWVRTLADWAVSLPARHWERLTQHARFSSPAGPAGRCVMFARFEASSFSRPEITLEHLLLGILREQPSLVPAAALEAVRGTVEAGESAGRRIPPMEPLRLSESGARALAAAEEIAHAAGRRQVLPRDLAAAILRETDTLAAGLLREYAPDLRTGS